MISNPQHSPLIILALDAGDARFLQAWAEAGHLPTLDSLMKRGCWGITSGPELISEHGVWTTLFSGISRGEHGYYYFRQLKSGSYDLQGVAGPDVDAPPFWAHTDKQNRRTAIIDVFDALPIPGLPGIQLSAWDIHDTSDPGYFRTTSEPPELAAQVQQKFGPKVLPLENHNSTFDEDRQILFQLLERVKKKGELCRDLLAEGRFDLIVAMFSECHAASHQFWKYHPDNRESDDKGHELTHAMRDVYATIDHEMGLLIEKLPENANVFIVSSVGLEDDYSIEGIAEAFFHQLDYQAAAPPRGISLKPMDLVRQIVPESWRLALSRHLPRQKREQLLADQFRRGTDWSRTRAFCIPSPYTTFVRVNLRGREPQGIVEPGAQFEALLDQIEADFKLLMDPETNEPAVREIFRCTQLFSNPHEALPDLLVEWKPGRYMDRVLHPRAELVQKKPDFFRRSDHTSTGFFAAAGPNIHQRGDVGEIDLLDLAPTFQALQEQPIPQKMKGNVADFVHVNSVSTDDNA